jgi:tryptophanyl-tRNA synthetase
MADTTEPQQADVNPWSVTGEVDYDKLIRDFGSHPIDDALLQRFEKVTGQKPHRFLRRGIFFSHRDMHAVLDLYEKGKPFYLYTGRGPSSDSMHMGHLVPFLFTKWLQDAFNVPLVIQMTDDEKYLWKDITLEQLAVMTRENARDIMAIGFDPETTFLFSNFAYVGQMYPIICRLQKALTASQVKGCFGFRPEDNVGKWAFPAVQAAPSFSVAFPHMFDPKQNSFCLIPCAIDQDPYFRLTRDVAPRLGWLKPALIHAKFFPALQGKMAKDGGKMSSSNPNSAIFLTDTDKQIKDKINSHAFSGGGATKEQQWELGANLEVDVPVQWLAFFLEDDDEYARLKAGYAAGRVMSGEVKKVLIGLLQAVVKAHKDGRKAISDEQLAHWMSVRPMRAHLEATNSAHAAARGIVAEPAAPEAAPAATGSQKKGKPAK